MEETLITKPGDLRPGDLFLGPIGGLVGLGVGAGQLLLGEGFRTGTLSIRHAAILTEAARMAPSAFGGPAYLAAPRLAQAMPSGAEVVPLDPEKHWTPECAWVRLPESYPGQGEDAAAVARRMVAEGVGYSFLTYPALAGVKLGLEEGALERWVTRTRPPVRLDHFGPNDEPKDIALPVRAICSRFVDFAWSATGMKVLEDTRRGVATPGMLADQLSYRPGVTWCRPRLSLADPAQYVARSWVV
jgi:hypothetical protein